jgi:hypothetical protein
MPKLVVVVLVAASMVAPQLADALVMCGPKKPDGTLRDGASIKLRSVCKPNELRVDPAVLGLQGTECGPDSARVGDVCVDLYEASIWSIPAAAMSVIAHVRSGTVTLAELISAGATQFGAATAVACSGAEYPANFPVSGQWSTPLYAVSLPGVLPSGCVSWFQAQQACALSGKRLPTNEEWQRAAAGTPDALVDDGTSDCNASAAGGPLPSGSRASCVSKWGIFDMPGNLNEYAAEWVQRRTACPGWGAFSDDWMCLAGADTTSGPTPLIRGHSWQSGATVGVFAIDANNPPWDRSVDFGFRCVR